ncbi:MAG: hypothetical protein NTX03_14995 [Bacteroidetes bacterium]|nr:hypothetical protein [Bacteroidota bacterium]
MKSKPSFKQLIYAECISALNTKVEALKSLIINLAAGAENDSKSSAGDKHETAKAMIQIEQEKLNKQLGEFYAQISILEKIDATAQSPKIIKGSLVKTDKGFFFLSIALGKISAAQENVIVLSPQSPLGALFMGLSATQKVQFNNITYQILEVD